MRLSPSSSGAANSRPVRYWELISPAMEISPPVILPEMEKGMVF